MWRNSLPLLALLSCAPVAQQVRAPVPVTDSVRIIGYGTGPTPDDARTRAIADIGAQLRASVEGQLNSVQSESLRSGTVSADEYRSNAVKVTSRFDHPEWVELLRLEPSLSGYEAVCAVDRSRAARSLEAELPRAESELTGQLQLANADAAAISVEKARVARTQLLEGTVLLAALRQRPPTWPTVLDQFDAWERTQRLQSAKSGLALCVTGETPAGSGLDLEAAARSVLSGYTERVTACGAGTTGWTLKAQVTVAPRQDPNLPGITFCTATLGATLLDPASRSTWSVADVGGRATKQSGRDVQEACRPALNKAAQLLAEQLPNH